MKTLINQKLKRDSTKHYATQELLSFQTVIGENGENVFRSHQNESLYHQNGPRRLFTGIAHPPRHLFKGSAFPPPRCLFKGSVYLICILALSKSRFLAESKKLKEEEQGQSENEDLQVFEIDEPHYCLKKLLSIKILL